MKHKVLLSLLLVLFSVTVAAQQEDKTVSTQDDEKVLQQGYREKVEQQQSVQVAPRQTWWNRNTLQKGYEGDLQVFIDGYIFEGLLGMAGIATSHGYQISPKIFLGAGLSFVPGAFMINDPSISSSDPELLEATMITPFANFRFMPLAKRVTPVIDIKAGYVLPSKYGLIKVVPSAGVRFGLGNRLGLNLGLGVPLFMSIDNEFGVLGGVRCYLGIDF